jgi:23S rRNA (cytosine1962-C5)-methyltransferase
MSHDRIDPDALARPAGGALALRVRPAAERALRKGHPWLFEDSITSASREGDGGDVAVVFDAANRFLAAGLYDPESPIRVRVLVHREPAEIGEALFRSRIAAALRLRSEVASRQTTGFRVLNGENDGMSGLVADLYDRTVVLQAFSIAWLLHLRAVVPALQDLLAPERMLLLVADRVAGSAACPSEARNGAVLFGPEPHDGIPFLETGLHFEAHPFAGHKTGFYLDQRDNRIRLGQRTSGARVLNVFSYTGGFSLHAARGGAREVVSVDRAAPALAQAIRHFELNGSDAAVAACRHRTVAGDAFEVMADMGAAGDTFDAVVVDPPSFARAARHRPRALAAYQRLTRLALPLVRPGGLLVQASCSSRIGAEEFFEAVGRAADTAGRPLADVERTGHSADHPVSFPEGAYLKCLWARVPSPPATVSFR